VAFIGVSFRNALLALTLAVQVIAGGGGVTSANETARAVACLHEDANATTSPAAPGERHHRHHCPSCVVSADHGASPLAAYVVRLEPLRHSTPLRFVVSESAAPACPALGARRARAPPLGASA